ncbi:MAG: SDR family oxidoreductase [Solirubrobacteraceae bacterium]
MSTLTGKIALLTGGSRGIGRAIAQRLALEGAWVAVHYGHDETAAQETVASIEGEGGQAVAIRAELGTAGDVDTLFSALAAELEDLRLDILVNNAGGSMKVGSIEGTTTQQFDQVFALNVRAPFFIIQRALPLLPAGGRIINISSADSRIALPAELAYSMAKGAVNVLGRTLAHAVGERGITVNSVAPGITDTEPNAWIHASPEIESRTASASAVGRIGQPADIADIVAFLASEDARWITGHLIDATGGTFLGPRL